MKFMTKAALITAGLFLLCTVSAVAAGKQENPKIGIFNFQKILVTSAPGKVAKEEINKKGKEMEESLKGKGQELEELKKTIEREALVMSKEKRDEKEREFRIKVNDFKTLQAQYQDEFKTFEAGFIKEINNDVLNLVQDMAKEEGYTLVFEQNAAGVVYSLDALDMTDRIISRFNKSSVDKAQ
ncbi:MAG: OmpH family outer membrane protein [Desulfobacterium sp.]|jgi:outer membrane protein|nr:OmpH family outer membrane protein [Desulfobacterium sp.]